MSILWLPPSEEQRLLNDRARQNVFLDAQVERLDFMETWNHELKKIDHRLHMVQAREGTNHPGLKPGRFYVLLIDAGVPTAIFPPDGSGYDEPSSQVYEDLKRWDGWSNRSERQREKRVQEMERARESRRRREAEDKIEETMERLKAHNAPYVGFSDVKWTNSTRGKRGRSK